MSNGCTTQINPRMHFNANSRLAARTKELVVIDVRVVSGSGGGPEKTILNTPRFLTQAGYESLCVYLRHPGDQGFDEIRRKALSLNTPLLEVDDFGPLDLGVIRRLHRICRERKVTIWHGHDYKSNLLGLLLRPFLPIRLISTAHGWVDKSPRTACYSLVDRCLLRRFERVLCVSEDLCQEVQHWGVSADRCTLVENAIDLDVYQRRRTKGAAKEALGIPHDSILLGAVGRLSPEKGFDLLIQAVGLLKAGKQNLYAVIAGEGPERRSLEQLIGRLGLQTKVRLLEYHRDPIEVYEALDIYVLSSRREGLPNVVLEAMAMRVPVVATSVAGMPRLLRNCQNGVLVAPGKVESLVGGISLLFDEADLREQLAAEAYDTIRQRYCLSRRMSTMCDIYDDLLGRRV